MTITLEQVEKLREKANVSFEEAKKALEQTDGDILEAIILLEREGKTTSHSTASEHEVVTGRAVNCHGADGSGWEAVKNFFRSCGRFIVSILETGSNNYLDVKKNDVPVISISVLAFVLLLILTFWFLLPLMFISLFFGYRYHVRGKELGKDSINEALDKAADTVQNASV